ncbi:MAG: flavin-containing monooxygenase [Solirubrobacterales bacterium]
MPTATPSAPQTDTVIEHLDVLIVGAGLSGIGAARNLQKAFPHKSYAILESRGAIGGTWDLFRYPGIRSDSDMFTLGYRFRPWTGAQSLADGDAIRGYIRDTAQENGIDQHIRFNSRLVGASWSSDESRWTIDVLNPETGEESQISCNFLHICSGYYRYDQGFLPEFEGIESFKGQVIHPQHWPEDLDYSGKRVVVIGSGATAVTLVPAMAPTAEHVTMLQRSPSYILTIPGIDPVAHFMRKFFGDRVAYPINRWKNVFLATVLFQVSQRRPRFMKGLLRKATVRQLPQGYDVDTHFKPRYNPWDQRMCMVPDGDLFRSIRRGDASIVTDEIERFTEDGLLLKSGERLDADIIVTATGLNLQLFGGADIHVDGEKVDLSETLAYKSMMLSNIPNMIFTVGYTNASWTLKADLVSEYACRLIGHMDEHGYTTCVPVDDDPSVETVPLLDFAAGYVLRSLEQLPKQGSKAPWKLGMNYASDVVTLRHGSLEDPAMRFSRAPVRAAEPVTA